LAGTCRTWGRPGPFRGELGDASEGSIRTAALIHWPGRIGPRSFYAMFSIMDFFPTLWSRGRQGARRSPDRRHRSDRLLPGRSSPGRRDALLTFVGPDLVAACWKQFRMHFAHVAPGRSGWGGAYLLPGTGSSAAHERLPKIFNSRIRARKYNIGAVYSPTGDFRDRPKHRSSCSTFKKDLPAAAAMDRSALLAIDAPVATPSARHPAQRAIAAANSSIGILCTWGGRSMAASLQNRTTA
jgi:hypothetical protein